MTKVKICGLRRECDVEFVNEAIPDYVGFVFAKSQRQVTRDQAAALRARLSPGIVPVGVFVNEKAPAIIDLLNSGVIEIAQLHGSENAEYRDMIRTATGKPVIQTVRVREQNDVERLRQGVACADYLLLDSGAGGGKVFDWHLLRGFDSPYLLAGGLDPQNVEFAVRLLHPWGVDVSSGVETDKKKDRQKIHDFIRRVRNA